MNIGDGGVRKLLERREDMTEDEQEEAARKREMQRTKTQGGEEVDVAEVFSPPRVAEVGKGFGLEAGASMDPTTGWDFTREEDRRAARE